MEDGGKKNKYACSDILFCHIEHEEIRTGEAHKQYEREVSCSFCNSN